MSNIYYLAVAFYASSCSSIHGFNLPGPGPSPPGDDHPMEMDNVPLHENSWDITQVGEVQVMLVIPVSVLKNHAPQSQGFNHEVCLLNRAMKTGDMRSSQYLTPSSSSRTGKDRLTRLLAR